MKYFCVVSYNGFCYYGFERQKSHPSIQAELERALSFYFGEPMQIKAAGRTDAKVHALGQTISFPAVKPIPSSEEFLRVINRLLPGDISVLSISEKPDDFDARHSSCGKVYEYRFYWGEKRPFSFGHSAHFAFPRFDLELFQEGLDRFVGEHDFSNFTNKPEDPDSFIRAITSIECFTDIDKKEARVVFQGNGFMRYQIRFMMGAAFKCAMHKMTPDEISDRLIEKPRRILSYKAPGEGLYLVEVLYQNND